MTDSLTQRPDPEPITAQEFGRIFSGWKPRFVAVAAAYVRDRSVAEDLVNDSFLSIWEKRESIPAGGGNLTAYLYRTVRNNCLNYLKSRQIRLEAQQQMHTAAFRLTRHRIATMESCDPDRLFAEEIAQIIRNQLDAMPPLTRNVFLASRTEEMTYRQIAERYGIPVRQVTAEIQKALRLMRFSLRDYLAVLVALLLWK